MALVTNSKDSLYGGINQQSAEHRLPTQVEECTNAFPTVNNGLLKRNPTSKLELSDNITYAGDMYTYAYDRGLSGESEEKYSVQITSAGMEIIDTNTGKVYTKANGGLVYDNLDAENYLYPFSGSNGYSAVTIKDTTFLLNKRVQPTMIDRSYNGVGTSSVTKYYGVIGLKPTSRAFTKTWITDKSYSILSDKLGSYLAPVRSKVYYIEYDMVDYAGTFAGRGKTVAYDMVGSTTKITIDGYTTSLTVTVSYSTRLIFNMYYPDTRATMSYSDWITNLYERIRAMLPANEYFVQIVNGDDIKVVRYDGVATSITFSITFSSSAFQVPSWSERNLRIIDSDTLVNIESDYYTGIISGSTSESIVNANTAYSKTGFIWIKGSNPSSAYTYRCTLEDSLAVTANFSTSATTTEAAASNLATAINAHASFAATASGSVVKIVASNGDLVRVETSDTYGNLASYGWAGEVSNYTELPKKLGFDDELVFIKGDITSSFSGYWLNYINGVWEETVSPYVETIINETSMPHVLTREFDSVTNEIKFKLAQWDKWGIRLIGDDDSNPVPSFINDASIKDIFFFKNRLGFITNRNVVMSEVGGFGNFFRTTVTALLDSDRIDTSVDTTKAIELEFATYLEDSLMLFSDKAQFKIEGGAILSPKSVQVSQTSAYEINKNIRPVFMNDKVFFCAKRGDYTAVMQYHIYGDGRVSEAVDITAHVEKYIPSDVKTLTYNSINNMLFITCESEPSKIYVYKYLDSGEDRVQSAWFDWEYNGEVYNAFSLGKNLNILINRLQSSAVSDWVLGTGIWESDKLWVDDGIWIGSPDDLTSVNNFEIQAIHPLDHTDYFIDASEFVEDTSVVEYLESTATSSALTYPCNVQMIDDIVVSIDNELILTYTIQVDTLLGNTYTSTNLPLTVPKLPSDFVTNITITINDASPAIFTGISFVYSNNASTQLLYNGLFDYGTTGWTFTDWTIKYGTKDVGAIIPVKVNLGEWVFKANSLSQTRGSLKVKTCQINSEDGSDFELEVTNVKRNSSRKVKSRYTVNRKPMVYGDSRDVRLSILNSSENGFRINSVSLEGNYNSRNKRTS